tara:strand:+ start:1252 stop:1380 length:129 start_codon:yes stop_codon:yes gene_type:complete
MSESIITNSIITIDTTKLTNDDITIIENALCNIGWECEVVDK